MDEVKVFIDEICKVIRKAVRQRIAGPIYAQLVFKAITEERKDSSLLLGFQADLLQIIAYLRKIYSNC